MRICLIRHARLSRTRRTSGRDGAMPPSPRGVAEQRAICAFRISARGIILSSPLARARSRLLIYGREADYLPPLSRMLLSVLEGRPTQTSTTIRTTPPGSRPRRAGEGGESFNGFTERVCAGFEALLALPRGRSSQRPARCTAT
ncbi:MAG: histidine phosphatase family protein [Cloacibacillus evryensis]